MGGETLLLRKSRAGYNSIIFNSKTEFLHFASSSWGPCWCILERRCPSEHDYQSRYHITLNMSMNSCTCILFNYFMYSLCLLLTNLHILTEGFHLKLPLITQFEPIQVTLQTDLVEISLSPSPSSLYIHMHHYMSKIYMHKHINIS